MGSKNYPLKSKYNLLALSFFTIIFFSFGKYIEVYKKNNDP